jgi:GAF domain-containing protein
MTNGKEGSPHGSYALKVGEVNRRYAQDLLAENERLRSVVASLESERARVLETVDDLRRRLADVETESRRFSEEYVDVERRNNDLMNLYVASYRLHGTLDRKEVLATIQEIVANLVGCEEQAVFEVGPGASELRLVASTGIDEAMFARVRFGDGIIGRSVAAGDIYVANGNGPREPPLPGEADLTACIPLKLKGRVTGAIALFRLLPQKARLEEVDHELFDLLATHAATALYCTRLHRTLSLGA